MPHLHSRWWITIRMNTRVLVLRNRYYNERWRRRWLSSTHHSCLRRSSVSATEILAGANAMHLDASLKHLLDCRWVNLICSAVYWWKSPGADKAWVAVAAKNWWRSGWSVLLSILKQICLDPRSDFGRANKADLDAAVCKFDFSFFLFKVWLLSCEKQLIINI